MDLQSIISFLDSHAGSITAIATIVLAAITIWYAISTYQILRETQVARKIKDIEYQLAKVYLPMEKAIEDYKSKVTAESFGAMDVNRTNLDITLREIKSRNLGIFDHQVMEFSTEFFSSPSLINLNKFLDAVNIKTRVLKKERARLIQDGKERLSDSNKTMTNGNNMIDRTQNREKEIEKRERLVQIYITIGSFFVAFSGSQTATVFEIIKENIIAPLFTFFLFFIILYHIFITRTKNKDMIDIYAFGSSFIYSVFIITFVISRSPKPLSSWYTLPMTAIFALIFWFSLLSPERSDSIVNLFEEIRKKHPYLMIRFAVLMAVIALGWFFWVLWNYWGPI